MPILYVETNFLIGRAKGQIIDAEEALEGRAAGVTLTIPVICFMEAYGVLKREKKKRQAFRDDLDRARREASRDVVSKDSAQLAGHLELAGVASDSHFNEIEARLEETTARLAEGAELIELMPSVLLEFASRRLVDDPTDNLILGCILAHAASRRGERKVFVSENARDFGRSPDVDDAFKDANLKYLTRIGAAIGWLGSSDPF